MATGITRSWTDRDGTEWEVAHEPPVELDTRRDRAVRERIRFRSGETEHHAPAVFGSDLDALSGADLQGLLDQARAAEDDRSAWQAAVERRSSR